MAGIIKSTAAPTERAGVGVVAFNFDDMTGKAHAYLQQVKAEAAQIVAKAQQEAAQICKQAQEQGAKGASDAAEKNVHTRVDAQVKQQMQTALPALGQLVQLLEQERHAWLRQWEDNALRLALAIAEKIVRREVANQPDITMALVKEALELAAGSQSIKVHLSPQDHAALGKQVAEVARNLARISPSDIVADPAVTAGGCVVHTEFGNIDQRIESQLKRIAEELA